MQMLYNSDSYVVVRFELSAEGAPARGGYEIVDKLARREIYLEGAVAERFTQGVQALAAQQPSVEQIDDFIAGYTALAQHPVVLH